MVTVVLDNLASGIGEKAILTSYPTLTKKICRQRWRTPRNWQGKGNYSGQAVTKSRFFDGTKQSGDNSR